LGDIIPNTLLSQEIPTKLFYLYLSQPLTAFHKSIHNFSYDSNYKEFTKLYRNRINVYDVKIPIKQKENDENNISGFRVSAESHTRRGGEESSNRIGRKFSSIENQKRINAVNEQKKDCKDFT
jgi:hypothetical protein